MYTNYIHYTWKMSRVFTLGHAILAKKELYLANFLHIAFLFDQGKDVVVVQSGIGKVNAAMSVQELPVPGEKLSGLLHRDGGGGRSTRFLFKWDSISYDPRYFRQGGQQRGRGLSYLSCL